MRILSLILALMMLIGCEAPQNFEDEGSQESSLRMKKYPKVAIPAAHGIPQVAAIVPRTGGWSGDNQIGYQAKYGPDKRGNQTILKLDEWGPPEVWTVSLWIEGKFTTYDGFSVTAQINFGAGGSTQTVEIDWLNGAQISLPMNALNVIAHFENVDVVTEGAGLSLGVQISRGSRGGVFPPVKTMGRFLLGASQDTGLIEIPAFARRIVVIPTAQVANFYTATTSLELFEGDGGGAQISGTAIGSQALSLGGLWLPVVNASRLARVSNALGGPNIVGIMYAEIDG